MLASQNNHLSIVQFLEEFKSERNITDMPLRIRAKLTRDALRVAAKK